MKVIIAGSRDLTDPALIQQAVDEAPFGPYIEELVNGGARGVDHLAHEWAYEKRLPIKTFPADWKTWGKVAGHIRNGQMADYADALIAIWDGVSPGTLDMITQARDRGLLVYVKVVK